MEFTDWMLVLGAGVLTAALRSYQHPWFRKLGAIGVLATSFLIGWLLADSVVVGVCLAAMWFFLPWIELLTRVRKLDLPTEKTLEKQFPPSRDEFPDLHALTSELDDLGFQIREDTGWNSEFHSQFFRLMYHPDKKLQANICLLQQQQIAFSYLSFTSRSPDGQLWTTWNYPLSYSLKLPPEIVTQRVPGEYTPTEMVAEHESFLRKMGVDSKTLKEVPESRMPETFVADINRQIEHNLAAGVLRKTEGGSVHYTLRGLFFLWTQFLRDLVRM